MKRTLGLIKPDATERKLENDIYDVLEANNMSVIEKKRFQMTKSLACQFYAEHEGKPFFGELVEYMTSAPIEAFIIEGDEMVVEAYRKLMGVTDPDLAEEGTLRKMFAKSKSLNSVHGSDSNKSADREIKLIFGL